MKNKLFLKKMNSFLFLSVALMVLLVSGNVSGQVTVFHYQNTTATIPTGWTLTNNITANAVDRTTYLHLEAGNPSDQIVTPNYDLTGYTDVALAYSVATFGTVSGNPALKLEVSTNGGTSWSTTTYTSSAPTSSTYVNGTLNITGQTFTSTTKFRFSNTLTTGTGLRNQNLKLTGTAAATAPTITSILTSSGTVGTVFNYATIASGTPTSYAASDLPSGLSINTSTGVISGTPTAVGSSNVSLSATNATGTDTKTLVITVGQGTQTITFGALAPITYGATSFSLNGASSSGLELSYSSSNTAVATISGNTVTIIGAGSTSITASQSGDANYSAAADVSQTLTVNKASQIISFPSLSSKLVSDPEFTLSASSTSPLAISYSSSNESVITISGNTATIIGIGTSTITASQSGNDNYNAAANVTQDQIIVSASLTNQTISFEALNAVTYGDASFSLTATGGQSGNPVTYASSDPLIASISGNIVSIVKPGIVTITASQAGNSSYNIAPSVNQILTINQKTLTVSNVVVSDKTYDGSLAAIISSDPLNGLVGTDDVSLSNSAVFADANVGSGIAVTPNFTLNGADASKYSLTQPTGLTATINKANQIITFFLLPGLTYSPAGTSVLSAISSSNLPIVFSSSNMTVASVSGDILSIISAGSTIITASQAGNNNYNAATSVTQSATISQAAQTIIFAALANKTTVDLPFALTASSTSGLSITYSSSNTAVATVSGNTVTIVGAGTTTIIASQSGNLNYNPATEFTRSLTVTAPPILTWNTFGNTGTETTQPSSSNNANIASATLNYTGSSVTPATNGNRFGGSNWAVGALSLIKYIQFTVTPNAGYVFSPTSFDFIWDFSASGPKSVTLRSSADGYVSDLGSLTTMTASSSTVKSISISGLIDISTATTFRLYGYDATAATGTGGFDCASSANNVVLNGFVNQLPAPSITSSLTATSTVGTVFTYATIASNSPSSYAATGLPSGLSINTSTGVISGTPTTVGSSSVTLSATNATGTDTKTLELTVGQGTQTITFAALAPVTYGATSFSLNGASSSGLPLSYISSNTAVATISGNTVTIVGAGTTSITASQSGDANYIAASDVSQTLTVNKAGQTITFNSLPDKLDTDPAFTLEATASSSLAVSFSSSNSAVISISGATATIVGFGTATITASQGGDNNYLAATNNTQNQLVISTALANQSITFEALIPVTYGDGTFNLTATGGESGNAVTYSSSDPTIASISGNIVSIIQPGTVTITASQAGNSSYNAAPSVLQDVIINKKMLTVSNVVVSDKTYDGSLAAIISSATLNGIVGTNDIVSLSNSAVFTDANVGNGIAVTPNFTLNGADALKYLLTQPTVSGNIIAGNQTITFDALPLKTFGDAAFNLIANGGASGNAITFISSNPAVASITGNTVTILAGGTVTITASQGGSLNYNAALDVTQTLVIAPKTQTITLFNTLGLKHINESSFNLGAVASSGGIPTGLPISYVSSNTDVATISGSTVTLVGVGLTTITASQAGNDNYLPAATSFQTLKVITPAIAAWNVSSLNGTATATATTFINLDATNNLMTRGLTAAASIAAASFRTTGFKNEGIATTNTDYFQVTLKPVTDALLSLSTLDATFNGTASYYANSGVTSQFAYSLDGTNFTLINSPVQSSSLTMATVDVSGISALQNVPSSSTVTLRYYASGQTTTGGWGFYSPTATSDAFSIGGQVILNTTPSPIANNQDFCGSGTVANLVAVGTDLKWYTASTGGAPLTSDVALVSGNYYVTQTINGFESLLRTQVLVSITPSSTNTTTTSAVGTYTWANNGQTYTSSGVYTGTTINCVTQELNLTITPLTASLSLQMFLDGYYIYGSNPASMRAARYTNLIQSVSATPGVNTDVDVITVELRSAASLNVVAYSVSPILQKNGSVQCTFPVAAYGNSYYVVVKHRSSLPLWSANPITISGSTALSFANNITNAYTNGSIAPMKTLVSGLYASRLGELNDDGFIDALDYAAFELDVYTSAYGGLYLLDADLNGDSYVDASDYAVFDFNSRIGSLEQRPY